MESGNPKAWKLGRFRYLSLPLYLSIYLPIDLSPNLSIYAIYLSIHLSISLSLSRSLLVSNTEAFAYFFLVSEIVVTVNPGEDKAPNPYVNSDVIAAQEGTSCPFMFSLC